MLCFRFFCASTKEDSDKGKCTKCRFNNGKFGNCTAGDYYAEKGLNVICYEGELWQKHEA